MALLADFPSGMNITVRSQGERDERSFCVYGGMVWLVDSDLGRDVGVAGRSNSKEPDGPYSWKIPPG